MRHRTLELKGHGMVHPRILERATLIALILQIVLAFSVHFLTFLPDQAILLGRMLIAACGGYLYGMEYGRGAAPCALGGAIAGGISVVPAVILSVILGDAHGPMIALATGASLLTGGVGGAFGLWAAELRRRGY